MARKSTPSAAAKEAAATSKVEKVEQDTPRRSGRATSKPENTPNKEAGRSRRSSTAAQTAASVAESRVTRSRASTGTRKTSSSPSGSSSSKSGREAGLESPASRVKSSRRSTGRVNYKESDGEEESRTRKKLLGDEADEDFCESESEESSKGPASKRKTSNSEDKESPVKGRAKSERVSSRRQSKTKNIEEEKETPGRKSKESENLDEASSSKGSRRSTRVRQSSGTPTNRGSRRSSRSSTGQPASRGKRSLRQKSELDAETEELMDSQEAEETPSQESTQEDSNTIEENTKKRKIDSDVEEMAEGEHKRIKLDSEEGDGKINAEEVSQKDSTEESTEKLSSDVSEEKQEIDSISGKKDDVISSESCMDSVGEIKEDSLKEISEEEPMEVDQADADVLVSDDKEKTSDAPTSQESFKSKVDEPENSRSSDDLEISKVPEDDQCSDEVTEHIASKEQQGESSRSEEIVDIASDSEGSEGKPAYAEKTIEHYESNKSSESAGISEVSPPVHDVDSKSEDSMSPIVIPPPEDTEKIPQDIDQTVNMDSLTPSGTAACESAKKDTDKNAEDVNDDKLPLVSELLQGSSEQGSIVSGSSSSTKENIECLNVQEDSKKSESSVNCLESPESTNPPEAENSSDAFFSLDKDKSSSLNGMHSEDSGKSIEIIGDGIETPFPADKESRLEEHPVPKANGAHDTIHDDSEADQPVVVLSGRRYVFNSSLKEDATSSLKDKAFELVSYNLGSIVEDGSSQKDELINELYKMKADVICLQEVTKRFYQDVLKPRLDALGYEGILSVPEESSPGIASFHKSTVFRLIRNSEASLQKLIEKDLEASSLESGDKAAVHSYLKKCGNVLFTQYFFVKGNNTLTVANVSMPSSDISTHALQMSCLVRELVTVIEGASKPLLLCGTFNMVEGEAPYQLLRDGYLSNDMIEELQRKKDIVLPGKENAALVNLLWKAFQHPSSNLCSCYAVVLGSELSIPGGAKSTSPDLLWFSSDCLHTVGVLDVAPSSCGGPKDHHVALKATVAFSN